MPDFVERTGGIYCPGQKGERKGEGIVCMAPWDGIGLACWTRGERCLRGHGDQKNPYKHLDDLLRQVHQRITTLRRLVGSKN